MAPRFTDQHKLAVAVRVAELRELGLSYGKIARQLKMEEHTVRTWYKLYYPAPQEDTSGPPTPSLRPDQ